MSNPYLDEWKEEIDRSYINQWKEEIDRLKAQRDAAYTERNKLVVLLAHLYRFKGRSAGRSMDSAETVGWQNVVLIDLPTGQVSWHIGDHDLKASGALDLPFFGAEWDGHTNEQKWKRIEELVGLYAELVKVP
jgi:hypothetical protein